MGRKAEFGWTTCKKGGRKWVVYKRDCPEYIEHVPTHDTKREAEIYVEEQKALGK